MKAPFPIDSHLTPKEPKGTPSVVRIISWVVSATAVVIGLIVLVSGLLFAQAAFSDDSYLKGFLGLILSALAFILALLILGASAAFFFSQSSRRRADPQAHSFSFVFAGFGLLFGFFMIFMTGGCLLEAAFPDGFGLFPDPEMAPWACCAAAVTFVPSLGFFRSQFSGLATPPRSPLLGLLVLMFVGVPLVVICVVGLIAAFPLGLLPGVGTFSALLMSTAALTLALPVWHIGLALRSGFGTRRD